MPRLSSLILLAAACFCFCSAIHQDQADKLMREAARGFWVIVHAG